MPDGDKTAMVLDELAALAPAQRREVAKELRNLSETFTEVSDGKATSHVLGVLAYLPDSWDGARSGQVEAQPGAGETERLIHRFRSLLSSRACRCMRDAFSHTTNGSNPTVWSSQC
jgi:hypothetical protein